MAIWQLPYRSRQQAAQRRAPSILDRIQSVATANPRQLALLTNSAGHTYAELVRRVRRFAAELQSSPDWRSGERVAIRLDNGMDYIMAFYGTLLAGGVAIPLPREQRREWPRGVLERTGCRWMSDGSSDSHVVPTGVVPTSRIPQWELSDLAAIFFTSGSTGDPKGVMLSHGNLIANASSIVKSLPLRTTDRALAVLPFCHAYGNSVRQSHLLSGATLVIAGSPTFPESLVEAMSKYAVTSIAGVPDLHRLLLRGSTLST